jgi:hypothetical protein
MGAQSRQLGIATVGVMDKGIASEVGVVSGFIFAFLCDLASLRVRGPMLRLFLGIVAEKTQRGPFHLWQVAAGQPLSKPILIKSKAFSAARSLPAGITGPHVFCAARK